MPNLEKLTADELHSGYLSRLAVSRDMEAKLVDMMKRKYEESLHVADYSLTDLRKSLAMQQDARTEADTKWRLYAAELEKIKTDLEEYKKFAEASQAALTKRAEDAEGRLKPVTEELTSLKRHITQMTEAVFGKQTRQLPDDSLLKLKALYAFTEQLYAGSLFTMRVVFGKKGVPKLIKDVLTCLSTVPKHFEEMKKSAARKGALSALSRALAYAPELNPEEIMGGFPQLKADGSEFTQDDYARCFRASRVLASRLATDADLTTYQAACDDNNRRVRAPTFEPKDLTPQRRKHIFAPDVDPSPILHDEAEFEALLNYNWDVDNLQIQESEDSA